MRKRLQKLVGYYGTVANTSIQCADTDCGTVRCAVYGAEEMNRLREMRIAIAARRSLI